MMRLIGLVALLAVTASCAVLPRNSVSAHPLDQTIWHVQTGHIVDRSKLVRNLAAADVVIAGELHDNRLHHDAQAWLTRALEPAGMAFEMIPKASEEGIAVLLADGADPADIGPAIGWNRIGWPDWDIYKAIFTAWTPQIYAGGGVSRADARRAIRDGAAAVTREPDFVPVLEQPLVPVIQTALEDQMIASHCGHLPRKAAPGMVEAQRLRDASFSAAVLRARAATSGGQVILITGNGHARSDRGVPAYLAQRVPELTVISIGLLEVDEAASDLASYGSDLPYDYVWFTQPADREDPCANFK